MLSRSSSARFMALTMVSFCGREEPCNGKSLTIVTVGPPLPSLLPCSWPPPPPPPHPATKNAAATPNTASSPTLRFLIALPPCLNPTTRTLDRLRTTPGSSRDHRSLEDPVKALLKRLSPRSRLPVNRKIASVDHVIMLAPYACRSGGIGRRA